MTTENWLSVPGYEDRYEVSDLGNVRSVIFGRVKKLKTPINSHGYPNVGLVVNGKQTNFRVHVLVALAFLGKRPDGQVINHINGDKADNRLCNLEYTSQHHNSQVGSNAKLTPENILEIRELLKSGFTQTAVAKRFNVTQRTIGYIHHGRSWSNITSPQESAS